MESEFITAVLDGTIKVADVDPSLQWGLVGGAAGGLGSAIKSIAGGEDLQTGLRHAALMGLLGAGVGGGISAGTRLLGYKGQTPGKMLARQDKNPSPSVAGSAGVGLAGAAGLGGLSEARQHYMRNKSIGELMYGGGAKDVLESVGKDGKKKKAPKASPQSKTIDAFLKKFRASKAVRAGRKAAPHEDLPGFFSKLLGRTNYSTGGLSALKDTIGKAEATGKSQQALHLRGLLKSLVEGEQVMKYAPAQRAYVDPMLKAVRSPKGLAMAAAALGLTHLGVSNLVHNLKKD